ncbi:flagellar hook-associated protein FlgK [Atopomonas sediminilitoris]|uniref:flagellar hook-associated protein FlgK n=1 Tax=Atopomonas sediminilitoris TaxID=2919919 RepID=UPI001F4E37ED|nr:flagellar hook-associated protein FlgK [Atopomonas sediminilitoris]MCJ8167963.1 flagellar hook-associated protein FlgK [Atopomonas sediminilitoris]
MADLLNIGLSGLAASKNSLTVTGHNIANVSTPGFSRQETLNATRLPQFSGAGYVGSGVSTADIRRIASDLLVSQLRSATSLDSQLSNYRDQIEQIDSLLANSQTGITPGLQKFFSAVQVAAEDPGSVAGRQLLLSEAEGLAKRFNTVYEQLDKQNSFVNQQLVAVTDKVNRLSASVAQYNDAIALAKANGKEPNDLLDAREEVMRQLSELVGISTVAQDDGSVNLFVGSGQPLVVGKTSATLSATPSIEDPSKFNVNFISGSSQQDITSLLSGSGGEIGGLLQFRNEVLDSTYNSLGRLSIAIADRVNQQLGQGIDLRGQPGAELFRSVNDPLAARLRVLAQPANTGTNTLDLTITDSSQLTLSDYEFEVTAAGFTVRRLSDQSAVASGALPAIPGSIAFDGLSLNLQSGTFNVGDTFTLQPTRRGATDIARQLDQADQLAFAGPGKGEATITNSGNGTLGPLKLTGGPSPIVLTGLTGATGFFGAGGLNLTFNAGTNQLTLAGSGSGAGFVPGGATTTITPGQTNKLTVSDGTYTFEFDLSGVPQTGDTFSLNFNANGVSNNLNGLELVGLQSKATIGVDPSAPTTTGASFTDGYSDLVERVGTLTSQARIDNEASEIILKQANDNRDSLSAVNLDEEAANLVQFQQYYQAAAQLIQVARSTFDTLISTFR